MAGAWLWRFLKRLGRERSLLGGILNNTGGVDESGVDSGSLAVR